MLLALVLPVAAVLPLSLGEEYPGEASDLSEEIKTEILDKFNTIRRLVQPTASNMLKMTWSERAAETAKKWSRKCQPKRFPREERKVDGILCGETRMRTTYPSSWSEVIETWNQKASNFEYGVGAIDPRKYIYFYTQMIWHNSHKIGCALAFCESNEYHFSYVCLYFPVGNLADAIATPYKEGPSCGDCPDNCEDKLCTNPCKYFDEEFNCKELLSLFSCENNIILNQCKATCRCPWGTM